MAVLFFRNTIVPAFSFILYPWWHNCLRESRVPDFIWEIMWYFLDSVGIPYISRTAVQLLLLVYPLVIYYVSPLVFVHFLHGKSIMTKLWLATKSNILVYIIYLYLFFDRLIIYRSLLSGVTLCHILLFLSPILLVSLSTNWRPFSLVLNFSFMLLHFQCLKK